MPTEACHVWLPKINETTLLKNNGILNVRKTIKNKTLKATKQ